MVFPRKAKVVKTEEKRKKRACFYKKWKRKPPCKPLYDTLYTSIF